jgi:hypothetical protein
MELMVLVVLTWCAQEEMEREELAARVAEEDELFTVREVGHQINE